MLITVTGVVRFVVVPSPSWPLLLYPQQSNAPLRIAQVW